MSMDRLQTALLLQNILSPEMYFLYPIAILLCLGKTKKRYPQQAPLSLALKAREIVLQ